MYEGAFSPFDRFPADFMIRQIPPGGRSPERPGPKDVVGSVFLALAAVECEREREREREREARYNSAASLSGGGGGGIKSADINLNNIAIYMPWISGAERAVGRKKEWRVEWGK